MTLLDACLAIVVAVATLAERVVDRGRCVVHKPRCESLVGSFMAAAMKIITRRATEIINRIAHAMTSQ
jgi:hypothetical protein